MTDIAGHHWFPLLPDLAAPGYPPLRPGRAASRVRPGSSPALDTPRPPLSTSIDRWLALYLRAHL